MRVGIVYYRYTMQKICTDTDIIPISYLYQYRMISERFDNDSDIKISLFLLKILTDTNTDRSLNIHTNTKTHTSTDTDTVCMDVWILVQCCPAVKFHFIFLFQFFIAQLS